MKGYWNMPEATAEVIDSEGWFHTGDIGEIDAEGFLRITDRKKELIINAYGKNIAPAPIENSLKSSRFIGQAVVIGDRRKFLSALLVPDFEALKPWAERQGIGAAGNQELIQDAQVRALIAQGGRRPSTRASPASRRSWPGSCFPRSGPWRPAS